MKPICCWILCFGWLACAPAPGGDQDADLAAVSDQSRMEPRAKPGAPVTVRGAASLEGAQISILFRSEARNVEVSLSGSERLELLSDARPIRGRAVAAGEVVHLNVDYTPGAEHSNLAVLVSGDFGDQHQSRVASFTVGRLAEWNRGPRALGDLEAEGVNGEKLKVAGRATQR